MKARSDLDRRAINADNLFFAARRWEDSPAARVALRPTTTGPDAGYRHVCSDYDAECVAWLADIARHLNTCDPVEIAAAALLESQGCERSQPTLFD
jgi:hypothetical protein